MNNRSRRHSNGRGGSAALTAFLRRAHAKRGTEPQLANVPLKHLVAIDAPRRSRQNHDRLASEMQRGWTPGLPRLVLGNFGDQLVILDGNHRYRAAKRAGLHVVPSVIVDGFVCRQAQRKFGVDRQQYLEALARLYPEVAQTQSSRRTVGARRDYERLRSHLEGREQRVGESKLLELMRGGSYRGAFPLPITGQTAEPFLWLWVARQLQALPFPVRVGATALALEMALPAWDAWLAEWPPHRRPHPDPLREELQLVRSVIADIREAGRPRYPRGLEAMPAARATDWLETLFLEDRAFIFGPHAYMDLTSDVYAGPWFAGFRAAWLFVEATRQLELLTFSRVDEGPARRDIRLLEVYDYALPCIQDCAFGTYLMRARGQSGRSLRASREDRSDTVLQEAFYSVYHMDAEAALPFVEAWWQRVQARYAIVDLPFVRETTPSPPHAMFTEYYGNRDMFPIAVLVHRGGVDYHTFGVEATGEPRADYLDWEIETQPEPWAHYVFEREGGEVVRGRDGTVFNLIERRSIVDAFRRHTLGDAKFVFNLADPSDAALAIAIYGTPDTWQTLEHEPYLSAADLGLPDFPAAFEDAWRKGPTVGAAPRPYHYERAFRRLAVPSEAALTPLGMTGEPNIAAESGEAKRKGLRAPTGLVGIVRTYLTTVPFEQRVVAMLTAAEMAVPVFDAEYVAASVESRVAVRNAVADFWIAGVTADPYEDGVYHYVHAVVHTIQSALEDGSIRDVEVQRELAAQVEVLRALADALREHVGRGAAGAVSVVAGLVYTAAPTRFASPPSPSLGPLAALFERRQGVPAAWTYDAWWRRFQERIPAVDAQEAEITWGPGTTRGLPGAPWEGPSLPARKQQANHFTADQADVFNRYFPLYTPVFFDANGRLLSPSALTPLVQAFRNVYVVAGREYAEQVAHGIFKRLRELRPDLVSGYGVYPVQVSPNTTYALDERALGWNQYLDGYDFPRHPKYRRWLLLDDGFIAPSVVEAIEEQEGTGVSDFAEAVVDAYATMDPIQARSRVEALGRHYAPSAVAGAVRALPRTITRFRRGDFLKPTIGAVVDLMPQPFAQGLAHRLLPPLRLIDGFTAYPEGDRKLPPWLIEQPALDEYLAVASGKAPPEMRRRLLRAGLAQELPLLPGQTPVQQAFPGLPFSQRPALPGPQAQTTQGNTVSGVEAFELEEMTPAVTQRLLELHRVFEGSLRGRLRYGVNSYFLNALLEPVFVDAFSESRTLTPPTKYVAADDYASEVRYWLKDLARAVADYQPDWTESVEAKLIHDKVAKAPSVQALLDGSYPVRHETIIGSIRPQQFLAWHEAGSASVGELAMDAANYTADMEGMAAGFVHAFQALMDEEGEPIPPQAVTGESFREWLFKTFDEIAGRLRDTNDPDHPVNQGTLMGEGVRQRFEATQRDRGLSDAQFNEAIRHAIALPERKEPGIAWVSNMTPLEVAQAAWVYGEMYYGTFEDGEELLSAAGLLD